MSIVCEVLVVQRQTWRRGCSLEVVGTRGWRFKKQKQEVRCGSLNDKMIKDHRILELSLTS